MKSVLAPMLDTRAVGTIHELTHIQQRNLTCKGPVAWGTYGKCRAARRVSDYKAQRVGVRGD